MIEQIKFNIENLKNYRINMKTSDIYLFLTEKNIDKIYELLNIFKKDFEKYQIQISKKGSSINFDILNDKTFVFTKFHLYNLCRLFINDIINELELNFIVDLIVASVSSFENEELLEELESLTDPEINGHITKDYVILLLGGPEGGSAN